jgi:hypothetical protein
VIIYELRCKNQHQFEGWFQDRTAFEEQKTQDLISCPVCGDSGAEIVLSSLTVMGKDAPSDQKNAKGITPAKAFSMLQDFINKHFDDVGDKFADVALKIHRGEEEQRNIKGTTTKDEEEALIDEGIHFIKIPITKLDS